MINLWIELNLLNRLQKTFNVSFKELRVFSQLVIVLLIAKILHKQYSMEIFHLPWAEGSGREKYSLNKENVLKNNTFVQFLTTLLFLAHVCQLFLDNFPEFAKYFSSEFLNIEFFIYRILLESFANTPVINYPTG